MPVCLSYRGQHLDIVCEVSHEGHDVHALIESFDATELHHESIFVAQRLHWFPVSLILTQRLHFGLCRQETHQTLHKVHAHRPQVEPAQTGSREWSDLSYGWLASNQQQEHTWVSSLSTRCLVLTHALIGEGWPTCGWLGRWPLDPGRLSSAWWPDFLLDSLQAAKLLTQFSEEVSVVTKSSQQLDPEPWS